MFTRQLNCRAAIFAAASFGLAAKMAALQSNEWRVHRESRSGLEVIRPSLTLLPRASPIADLF